MRCIRKGKRKGGLKTIGLRGIRKGEERGLEDDSIESYKERRGKED